MKPSILIISGVLIILLSSCDHIPSSSKQIVTAPPAAINDDQLFRTTFSVLQKSVKENNKELIKTLIHFPLPTTNDGELDGEIHYNEFNDYYSDIFHKEVRRLLPMADEDNIQEIDSNTTDAYYKILKQTIDSASKLYEVYIQYPEKRNNSESYFAFVFGRIYGEYKVVGYYAKWPVKTNF
ncbi:hypothetical protein DVR12_19690 [Chitinophaga silvatica]|uniref:Uncharacterized protein n=1 Tax=Chitinophaga silvatica TaxID=2282649 RepID=A0A3E1Y5F1_9BACT|nr:hypothetical protein [Chitinophaga silvatica]RFS19955.1 hypothetical protein DVR12_19690 [Chitinophaga silvatica]